MAQVEQLSTRPQIVHRLRFKTNTDLTSRHSRYELSDQGDHNLIVLRNLPAPTRIV